MIGAVGHHYYDAYFNQCSRLLKPDGLCCCRPSPLATGLKPTRARSTSNATYFQARVFPLSPPWRSLFPRVRLTHCRPADIGPHYARTLRIWRERFFEHIETVRSQGFNEEFIRMWAFYLCYCEAGFAERYIGDAQILLAKPQNRRHAEFA